jgi:hypothetical protein
VTLHDCLSASRLHSILSQMGSRVVHDQCVMVKYTQLVVHVSS